MFKPLLNTIQKKKSFYINTDNLNTKINKLIGVFFKQQLDIDLKNFDIKIIYSPGNKNLTIKTNNKTLASEISLHLSSFIEFLKDNKIPVVSLRVV